MSFTNNRKPLFFSVIELSFYRYFFFIDSMYFALGHFSKYIPQDSSRIDLQFISDDPDVTATAFLRPDGKRAVVVLNR